MVPAERAPATLPGQTINIYAGGKSEAKKDDKKADKKDEGGSWSVHDVGLYTVATIALNAHLCEYDTTSWAAGLIAGVAIGAIQAYKQGAQRTVIAQLSGNCGAIGGLKLIVGETALLAVAGRYNLQSSYALLRGGLVGRDLAHLVCSCFASSSKPKKAEGV